jgi:hypothetical protein
MGLDEVAQQNIAVVLADVFGEPIGVAREIASFLDGYLRSVPSRAALGLRLVVWAITWLPIVFVGVPRPAHALSPATRARYLKLWAGSRVY